MSANAYPHTVHVWPRRDADGYTTYGWSCGCGRGDSGFDSERVCRDIGFEHQREHTRAFEARMAREKETQRRADDAAMVAGSPYGHSHG